ncbi:macrophage mannose receptor 1-like [Lingula anatina]|uniref:Macrophage mannose receptor 1-like n=1 Tax=Lingula anatina TaxID=7574 RepID=A0A1S3IYH3_LINAN|nr:macrophage mannose receptor 1-like [Lingula anatina]|eukprot:XP_013403252.1 macrophage mannose receptor 1-like [Lingula anatina]
MATGGGTLRMEIRWTIQHGGSLSRMAEMEKTVWSSLQTGNGTTGLATASDSSSVKAPSVYTYVPIDLSYSAATVYCRERGAHLATAETREELSVLYAIWQQAPGGACAGCRLWLGADDIAQNGDWRWNAANGDPVEYSAWKLTEPNGGDSENCMEFFPDETWNDRTCSTLRHFICEGDFEHLEPKLSGTAAADILEMSEQQVTCSQSPPAVYTYVHIALTYSEATEYCRANGTHLATAETMKGLSILYAFWKQIPGAGTRLWMGADDIAQNGDWRWTAADGDPVDYYNWRLDEPNGGDRENCMELYTDGGWNDLLCSRLKHFICEG